MPNVVIVINVAGQAPGVPGESRAFDYSVLSPTPPLVSVELNDTTGVDNYFWEFLDKPESSTAVFDDPTSPAPTFTPDVDLTSTYLIQCSINDAESRGQIGLAFRTERLDVRKLAAGEGPQFDDQKGWVEAYNDFVDKVEGLIIGGNVIGPDPATIRAIATYANVSGNVLLDNLIRIETGQKWGDIPYRSIQARDEEGSPTWRDLIGLDNEPPNGSGGYRVVIGNLLTQLYLATAGEPEVEAVGGRGKLIHEKISLPWEIKKYGGIISPQAYTQAIFYLGSTGGDSGRVDMYAGAVDPNGLVTGEPGSIFYRCDGVSSAIYQHRGAAASNSDWVVVVGGGGGDFVGPASSTVNALVLFANGTGKLGRNSPVRLFEDTNENSLQIFETGGSPSWRDALRLREIGPNGLPGGQTLDVGDAAINLLLSSLTDPYVQIAGTIIGKIIHQRVAAGWEIENAGTLRTLNGDTTAPVTLKSNPASNGAATQQFVGDRDPTGNVTGNPGDTYTRVDTEQSNKYLHRGASADNTSWFNFSLIGGTSLGETWTFTNSVSGDPGSKHFLLNNAVQASATAIHVSDTAENGVDFSSVLLRLRVNDAIYIQQGDDPSRYFLATVTGPAVDQTTYVSIPITVNSSGTPFGDEELCPNRYMFSSAGGGTGTTANIGVYAYLSGGNMTLPPSGPGYVIRFNAKRDDSGGDFTLAPDLLPPSESYWTCPTAGRYTFCANAHITIDDPSGGAAELYIQSSVHGIVAASADHTDHSRDLIPSVSASLYCDAGEEIRIVAFQDSTWDAVLEQEWTHFSCSQIVQV